MKKTTAASGKRPRRQRNPERTREAILEAAREVLAKGGAEGLSVAQVAQRAGVNRGTAYQYFLTREQLVEATATWVSDKLYQAVFGDLDASGGKPVTDVDPKEVTDRVMRFAMENPELGRVWLFELLSSRRPASDPFWQAYESRYAAFARTENAQPGIDVEVAAVMTLVSTFLWPVWARAHARNAQERQELGRRFTREVLRYSLHGTLRPEKFRDLDQRVSDEGSAVKREK
jgi:AcrR family transcriptional regulator